jgi:hypothetical protein
LLIGRRSIRYIGDSDTREQQLKIRSLIGALLNRRGERLTTYRDRHMIASAICWVPLSLSKLLELFGTDKQKYGEHSYGATYARLFRGLRYKRLKILEIGILAGESLLSWRAFFPRAVTIGMDIEEKQHFAIGQKTRCYQGDQSSTADLDRIATAEGPFDIVLDDGSHLSRHQIFTFLRLFPHIRDAGIYIVEDVQTSFWTGRINGVDWDGCGIADPQFDQTCYGWFLELAKYLNHSEFDTLSGVDLEKLELGKQIKRVTFEHNLIIVEKGQNISQSNYMKRQASCE